MDMQIPPKYLLIIVSILVLIIASAYLITPGFQPTDRNFAYSYFGINTQKNLKITQDAHEETISVSSSFPELDVVLFTYIPKALADDIGKVKISSNGKMTVLESDPLIMVEKKNSPDSIDLKLEFQNQTESATINVLLPENFVLQLSEAQLSQLSEKLLKLNDVNQEITIDNASEIEAEINANLSQLFLPTAELSAEENSGAVFFDEAEAEQNRFAEVPLELVLAAIDNSIEQFLPPLPKIIDSIEILLSSPDSPRVEIVNRYADWFPEMITLTLSEQIPEAEYETWIVYPELVYDSLGNPLDSISQPIVEIEGPLKDYIGFNLSNSEEPFFFEININPALNPEVFESIFGRGQYKRTSTLKLTFSDFFPSKTIEIPIVVYSNPCKTRAEDIDTYIKTTMVVADCYRTKAIIESQKYEDERLAAMGAGEALLDDYISVNHISFLDPTLADSYQPFDYISSQGDLYNEAVSKTYLDRYDANLLESSGYNAELEKVDAKFNSTLYYFDIHKELYVSLRDYARSSENINLEDFVQLMVNGSIAEKELALQARELFKNPFSDSVRDKYLEARMKYILSLSEINGFELSDEDIASLETQISDELDLDYGNYSETLAKLKIESDNEKELWQYYSITRAQYRPPPQYPADSDPTPQTAPTDEEEDHIFFDSASRRRELYNKYDSLYEEHKARYNTMLKLEDKIENGESILELYLSNNPEISPAFRNTTILDEVRLRRHLYYKPFLKNFGEAEQFYNTIRAMESARESLSTAITVNRFSLDQSLEHNVVNWIDGLTGALEYQIDVTNENIQNYTIQRVGIIKIIALLESGKTLLEIEEEYSDCLKDETICRAFESPFVDGEYQKHKLFQDNAALLSNEATANEFLKSIKPELAQHALAIAHFYRDNEMIDEAVKSYGYILAHFDGTPAASVADEMLSQFGPLTRKMSYDRARIMTQALTTPTSLAIFIIPGAALRSVLWVARGWKAASIGRVVMATSAVGETRALITEAKIAAKFSKIKEFFSKPRLLFGKSVFTSMTSEEAMTIVFRNAFAQYKYGGLLSAEEAIIEARASGTLSTLSGEDALLLEAVPQTARTERTISGVKVTITEFDDFVLYTLPDRLVRINTINPERVALLANNTKKLPNAMRRLQQEGVVSEELVEQSTVLRGVFGDASRRAAANAGRTIDIEVTEAEISASAAEVLPLASRNEAVLTFSEAFTQSDIGIAATISNVGDFTEPLMELGVSAERLAEAQKILHPEVAALTRIIFPELVTEEVISTLSEVDEIVRDLTAKRNVKVKFVDKGDREYLLFVSSDMTLEYMRDVIAWEKEHAASGRSFSEIFGGGKEYGSGETGVFATRESYKLQLSKAPSNSEKIAVAISEVAFDFVGFEGYDAILAIKSNNIFLGAKYVLETVTHERVHALFPSYTMGIQFRPANELLTDLATLVALPDFDLSHAGNFFYLTKCGVKREELAALRAELSGFGNPASDSIWERQAFIGNLKSHIESGNISPLLQRTITTGLSSFASHYFQMPGIRFNQEFFLEFLDLKGMSLLNDLHLSVADIRSSAGVRVIASECATSCTLSLSDLGVTTARINLNLTNKDRFLATYPKSNAIRISLPAEEKMISSIRLGPKVADESDLIFVDLASSEDRIVIPAAELSSVKGVRFVNSFFHDLFSIEAPSAANFGADYESGSLVIAKVSNGVRIITSELQKTFIFGEATVPGSIFDERLSPLLKGKTFEELHPLEQESLMRMDSSITTIEARGGTVRFVEPGDRHYFHLVPQSDRYAYMQAVKRWESETPSRPFLEVYPEFSGPEYNLGGYTDGGMIEFDAAALAKERGRTQELMEAELADFLEGGNYGPMVVFNPTGINQLPWNVKYPITQAAYAISHEATHMNYSPYVLAFSQKPLPIENLQLRQMLLDFDSFVMDQFTDLVAIVAVPDTALSEGAITTAYVPNDRDLLALKRELFTLGNPHSIEASERIAFLENLKEHIQSGRASNKLDGLLSDILEDMVYRNEATLTKIVRQNESELISAGVYDPARNNLDDAYLYLLGLRGGNNSYFVDFLDRLISITKEDFGLSSGVSAEITSQAANDVIQTIRSTNNLTGEEELAILQHFGFVQDARTKGEALAEAYLINMGGNPETIHKTLRAIESILIREKDIASVLNQLQKDVFARYDFDAAYGKLIVAMGEDIFDEVHAEYLVQSGKKKDALGRILVKINSERANELGVVTDSVYGRS